MKEKKIKEKSYEKMHIDKTPMYLFNNGTNYESYKMLGAHKTEGGYFFAVWAPNAKAVSVVEKAPKYRYMGGFYKRCNR